VVVSGFYQQYLLRPMAPGDPTPAACVNFLTAGGTMEQLRTIFISCPEYYQRHGNTNAGFVEALYRDALGHTAADNVDAQAFKLKLDRGQWDRQTLVVGIIRSEEYFRELVKRYYDEFLDRPYDPVAPLDFQGMEGRLKYLQGSTQDEQIIAGILGDARHEFYDKTLP
jgi:hypothetical protein